MNAQCHKSMFTMANICELGIQLLPRPWHYPNLAPNDHYTFASVNKSIFKEKRFGTNIFVVPDTEMFVRDFKDSFYIKDIKRVDKRRYKCIILKEFHVDK